MCRNPALTRLIADALEGTADGAALLDGYDACVARGDDDGAGSHRRARDLEQRRDATPAAAPAGMTPNRIGPDRAGAGPRVSERQTIPRRLRRCRRGARRLGLQWPQAERAEAERNAERIVERDDW